MADAKVERRHLEEAARIVRPRCTQEGMRVFCLSPTPQMARVAQALANAESAQPVEREWVSVEERLPEHQQMVLFWVSDWTPRFQPDLCVFIYDGDVQWWNGYNTKDTNTRGVTHWMPLPAAPQPKGKP